MRRITITITDDAYKKAEEQAAEVEITPAQWASWVVENYDPPRDGPDEETV